MPISFPQATAFLVVAVLMFVLLRAVGVELSPGTAWAFLVPPGVAAWLANRPVADQRSPLQWIGAQLRYLPRAALDHRPRLRPRPALGLGVGLGVGAAGPHQASSSQAQGSQGSQGARPEGAEAAEARSRPRPPKVKAPKVKAAKVKAEQGQGLQGAQAHQGAQARGPRP